MTAHLAHIWRHPIKGIGAERVSACDITANRPLPFDRAWALLQQGGDASPGWRLCRNFIRGAKGPSLMAITARVGGGGVHLRHPDRPDIHICPDHPADAARLIDWITPIYPSDHPAPATLVRSPEQGMSDANFPSVSILGLASLRALSDKIGRILDPRRFRGNLWVKGLTPWQEFDWIGQTITIGPVRFKIIQPITRCRATEANPETGQRDAPILQTLRAEWGHTDFGVYATPITSGRLAENDQVTLP